MPKIAKVVMNKGVSNVKEIKTKFGPEMYLKIVNAQTVISILILLPTSIANNAWPHAKHVQAKIVVSLVKDQVIKQIREIHLIIVPVLKDIMIMALMNVNNVASNVLLVVIILFVYLA